MHLESNRRSVAAPPLGRLRLPRPHPIVGRLKPSSSTSGSRGLYVRLRSSSLQFSDARLLGARGGGTESFAPRLLPLLPALGGSAASSAVVAASSSLLLSRPYRAARRASSSSAQLGEALLPPDPHPIGQPPKGGFPPLVVVAGFTFLGDTHRQFSGLAPAGRPRELPLRSPSSLAGSRWAARKRAYSRSSSRRSPGSPLTGRPRELVPPLSTGGKLRFPPDHPSNRSGGLKASFSPLVVLAGFTLPSSSSSSVLLARP